MCTVRKIDFNMFFVVLLLFLTTCSLVDIESSRPKSDYNRKEDTGPTIPTIPAIPSPDIPVVTALDGMITVRWTAVEEAENYQVFYGPSLEPPAAPAKTVTATTTVLDGLVNKTTYYVWIKAKDETRSSAFSPRGQGIPWPENEAPGTPGRPILIPGINQLTANWEESGGAASYEVYINTSIQRPSLPEITTEKRSAVFQTLENERIYYLWVRAVNGMGKSDYSPLESGTPKIPTKAPSAVDRPTLTAGSRELIVSWQAVEWAGAYEVWLGTNNNSSLAQKRGSDIEGGTETVLTGLVNETTYYVWIRAKNIAGKSGFSPSASAKPTVFAVLPGMPAMPTVITGFKALDISWPAAAGALSYEVWSSVSDNPANAEKHGADVSRTSVTLTNLVNETTYYIWIKAKNSIGESGFSPMGSGTPSVFAAKPSAPLTAPVVTAGNNQLTVSWQQIEGANAYEVWIGTTNNYSAATKRADVSGLSIAITGLSNGTPYYVWVKAKNSAGTSDFSPVASITPSVYAIAPQAPAAPSVRIGNEQISLSWVAVEGAMDYETWLATEDNSAFAAKHGSDITTLSTTISGLNDGTAYYVWLRAKNSSGTSGFSPSANGKPIADTVSPLLTAGNSQISASWTATAGADQYEIFYGTGVNPPPTATQTVTTTSATITGLVNGTTYNVWIRGRNSSGLGAISNPANAKPIGNIGAVTVNAGNGRLSLSWAAVAGADQYEVFYSTSSTMPGTPAQTVSATTATISGLTNGTTYYVWGRGKNANGLGGANTVVSGKPLGTPEAPVLTPGYGQLAVTWTAVTGAEQYEVYYGIGTATILATITAGTTATITGLTNTAYHVRLRAKNANGVSDYGQSISGTPFAPLSHELYRGAVKIGNHNLSTALSWISANAVNGDIFSIVLGADESASPMILNYSGRTVGITLLGSGIERKISLNANGSLFTVNAGVTLTLDTNISLVGRSTNNASLVYVNGGNLIINDGAKITGNNAGNTQGGGINVQSSGTLTLNGGIISGNTANNGGGGMCIFGNAVIHSGKINGNEDKSGYGGGGIFVFTNGTLIMHNGTISGNTAARFGGGVYVYSSGASSFTMHGGVISGNTSKEGGGGVQSSHGTFKKQPSGGGQNSGIIYGSEAAGVDADGKSLKNTSGNNGHAVYSTLKRNTTAGQTDHIDTTTGKGLSVSGNPPFGN
ncbi:MAG: fibronectin type III domain-containing protein [Treponema sp.]|nr:fibronectin type III domain-containing protein [Treponema sp.]